VRLVDTSGLRKLAGCQLNFDEDTFQSSTGRRIVDLDVSSNAFQGVMGVRCLLRCQDWPLPSMHD
ncbi:unnamed protein product, partial [Symbiodinium sp. CCMP2456]